MEAGELCQLSWKSPSGVMRSALQRKYIKLRLVLNLDSADLVCSLQHNRCLHTAVVAYAKVIVLFTCLICGILQCDETFCYLVLFY